MNKYKVQYEQWFGSPRTVEVFANGKREAEKVAFLMILNGLDPQSVNTMVPFKTVKKLVVTKTEIVNLVHE